MIYDCYKDFGEIAIVKKKIASHKYLVEPGRLSTQHAERVDGNKRI
jgi:hypothetical protein